MTASQAISKADGLVSNSVSTADKLAWLSAFDAQIRREVADDRQGAPETPFRPYDSTNDTLFISDEDGDVYVYMLLIRLLNFGTEADKEKTAKSLFDKAYSSWRNAYAASHPHTSTKVSF